MLTSACVRSPDSRQGGKYHSVPAVCAAVSALDRGRLPQAPALHPDQRGVLPDQLCHQRCQWGSCGGRQWRHQIRQWPGHPFWMLLEPPQRIPSFRVHPLRPFQPHLSLTAPLQIPPHQTCIFLVCGRADAQSQSPDLLPCQGQALLTMLTSPRCRTCSSMTETWRVLQNGGVNATVIPPTQSCFIVADYLDPGSQYFLFAINGEDGTAATGADLDVWLRFSALYSGARSRAAAHPELKRRSRRSPTPGNAEAPARTVPCLHGGAFDCSLIVPLQQACSSAQLTSRHASLLAGFQIRLQLQRMVPAVMAGIANSGTA